MATRMNGYPRIDTAPDTVTTGAVGAVATVLAEMGRWLAKGW